MSSEPLTPGHRANCDCDECIPEKMPDAVGRQTIEIECASYLTVSRGDGSTYLEDPTLERGFVVKVDPIPSCDEMRSIAADRRERDELRDRVGKLIDERDELLRRLDAVEQSDG